MLNLNPNTDYRQPYVVNPVYETMPKPKPTTPGKFHEWGTCGYMNSLCGRCHEQEARWHMAVGRAIANQEPPMPGEGGMEYWQRMGGRWFDTWPEALDAAYKQAGFAGTFWK
jgi:hypothetical protein